MGIAYFNRKVGMKLEVVAEGALTADGSEQDLVVCDNLAILTGYTSMSEMVAGDTIIIKQYMTVNGHEELYHQETYSGVPTEPIIHFQSRPHKDRTRITLQQVAGPYKIFNYEFVREV